MKWPDVLTINGIEYRHHCAPFNFGGVLGLRPRRTWVCPCGTKWWRASGKKDVWQNFDPEEEKVEGSDSDA